MFFTLKPEKPKQSKTPQKSDLHSFFKVYFMYVSSFPSCMSVHYVRAWFLWRLENGLELPGTRVIDIFAIMWLLGIDLGTLEEHPVLLTLELPLQL